MKAIIIILLALGIFGAAGYFTWELFVRPQQALRAERGQPPPPPPPDPTIPELKEAMALYEEGKVLECRTALQAFIERHPRSSVVNEAKDRVGSINASLFLSAQETPEKTVYIVKPNDVIVRVANKFKSSPELIMRANNLQNFMLRIGQRLVVAPLDFSLTIERDAKKVVLLRSGKFFKHYPILSAPTVAAPKGGKAPPKLTGKVSDIAAWKDNNRVIFTDKAFAEAESWVVITPHGHSLFPEHAPGEPAQVAHKPPGGGYGLAPENLRELAALLRKNDDVTIE